MPALLSIQFLFAFIVSSIALLYCSLVAAQPPQTFTIPRTNQVPTINGVLEENEWAQASSVLINIEVDPGDNIEAEVLAEALLMEDGEVLYVAYIAQDPDPSQIRGFYQDRDRAWEDDWIAIILDTFNDERRAFEFIVNPLGVQMDAIFDDVNGREDDSWNAIWDSVGQITESGYNVELAIPLKQLRFTATDSLQTRGIDIARY